MLKKGNETKEIYKTYIKASAAGLEVGLSILVGSFLGILFDRYVGTGPWGFLIGLIVGVIAAIKRLVRFVRKYLREDAENERSNKPDA